MRLASRSHRLVWEILETFSPAKVLFRIFPSGVRPLRHDVAVMLGPRRESRLRVDLRLDSQSSKKVRTSAKRRRGRRSKPPRSGITDVFFSSLIESAVVERILSSEKKGSMDLRRDLKDTDSMDGALEDIWVIGAALVERLFAVESDSSDMDCTGFSYSV